jgi:hypothetical protein
MQALTTAPSTLPQILTQYGYTSEFVKLPKTLRAVIERKVCCMCYIEELLLANTPRMQAYRAASVQYHANGRDGLSVSAIAALFPVWSQGGRKRDAKGKCTGKCYQSHDWRLFAPQYTNGDRNAVLRNQEFTDYIASLATDSSRPDAQGRAVFFRFTDAWYKGEEIPGIGNKYDWAQQQGRPVADGVIRRDTDLPDGCSLSNIQRIVTAKLGVQASAKRKLLQRGEFAAHAHWGDMLLRDRSKLMPLQLITFDDVEFDIKVWMDVDGTPQVVRPAALFALDVATGVILAKGVAPAYTRERDGDGGKAGTKRGLQHADMRFLLLSILETYGIPQDWQIGLLMENATAAMSGADKLAFESAFGEQVRFETTGRIRAQLLKSGFLEQGGMPWEKGWIEAFFRALHCRINHLPGTIGRRYELTHGEMGEATQAGSKVHYVLKTLEMAKEKGIPTSELALSSILLSFTEFEALLHDYVMRLNWRTMHKLQGFEQVTEFCSSGQWIRADDPRAGALLDYGTSLSRRMEAPLERMARLVQGHRFSKPHPLQMAALAMDKRVVTVRSECIRISRTGADDLVYRDADNSAWLSEYNGREKAVMVYLSTDSALAHCFTAADNAYLGSVGNVRRIDLTDEKAILKRSGEVHRARQEIRHEVAEILSDRNELYADDRAHNARVLAPEQIQQAEQKAAGKKASRNSADRNLPGLDALTPARSSGAIDEEDLSVLLQ